MSASILFVQGAALHRRAPRFEIRRSLDLCPFCATLGGQPGGEAVQHCPYFIEIPNEVHVQGRYDQTPAGSLPNQTAVAEKQESLLHGLTGDAIGAGQLILN